MAVVVDILGRDKLSGKLGKIGSSVGRLAKNFVKFGVLAGGAIAGVSIKMAADMEKGLREIGTLMGGLTQTEMKAMGHELEMLAASSGQAMQNLTKARYDIVSAGFADAASSAELLRVSAELAVGGVTEVSTAADLLTTAINAYGLAAEDAVDVSDKLFTIVRLGKTTMSELGTSMGRLLAITAQANISIEEAGAALAALTASGQQTEEAVTAIRAATVQLLKPTQDLADFINALGYESGVALIEAEGFAGAVRLIKERADETGVPMTDLFNNVRAMQAVLPLTGTAAGKFEQALEGMGDTAGATAGAFEEMQKSFSQQAAMLKQNLANIMRAIGRSLIEIIQPRVEEANEILSSLGEIGWDVVATTVAQNWRLVLDALVQITQVVGPEIGKALQEGITLGLKGFVEAVRNVTTRPLARLLFGWAMKVEEDVGGSFESLGENVSEIITNLIAEINRLAEESKPPLEETAETVDKVGEALEGVGTKVEETTERVKVSLGEQAAAWVDAHKEMIDTVGQFAQAAGALYSGLANMRRAEIQKELNAEIEGVLASAATEEEKQATISNLREIYRKKEEKALKALKPIKLAQAISSVAVGVAKALSSTIPPWNLVLAGITAAAGAAEIAAIRAQPYKLGGRVPSFQLGGAVPILAHEGEIVSTRRAADRFGPEITQMNQLAEGIETPRPSRGDVYNIYAFDARSFEEFARRNPEGFAEGVRGAKKGRFLKAEDLRG